jgi:hypothetical protein
LDVFCDNTFKTVDFFLVVPVPTFTVPLLFTTISSTSTILIISTVEVENITS